MLQKAILDKLQQKGVWGNVQHKGALDKIYQKRV